MSRTIDDPSFMYVSAVRFVLHRKFAPAFAESNSPCSHTFVLSGTRVNAKTGSGVHFNRHIDSDLHGFTRETMHKIATIKQRYDKNKIFKKV
jgi:hypothetical protein